MRPGKQVPALAVAALLWGGVWLPCPAVAAEAEAVQPKQETDRPSVQQDDAAPAEAPTPGGDSGTAAPASPDVFLPTEEISEDFAAPFPVDV